jgi:hypothetical protein
MTETNDAGHAMHTLIKDVWRQLFLPVSDDYFCRCGVRPPEHGDHVRVVVVEGLVAAQRVVVVRVQQVVVVGVQRAARSCRPRHAAFPRLFAFSARKLSTSRLLGRFFSVGASARGFSFEKNLDDGYFDPDFYGIGELTGYWLYRPAEWTLLLEVAPGAQKVFSDGSWGATIRSNARVAYRVGPGREVSLAFGYSSAGLVSFSSTASNYRYTTFVLGSNWTF